MTDALWSISRHPVEFVLAVVAGVTLLLLLVMLADLAGRGESPD